MKTSQHEIFVYFAIPATSTQVKELVLWIEEKGWKLIKGKKSDALLDELGTHPFALAVLPYEPSDCSSIKNLYEIKLRYPDISVVYYYSGEVSYDHLVYALNEGADGFITGSLDKTQILTLFERKVRTHDSRSRLAHRVQNLEKQLHQIERESVAVKTSLAELEQKLSSLTMVIGDILTNSESYLGQKKVIVVSDSNYQKNMIANFLREKNIQPVLASYRKEAVELAKTISPVVVVSDYELDDGTGKDLASDLKSDPQIKNPYIIICSAAQSLREELLSPASPVDDFLCKQSLDALISSIVIAYYTIKQRSANY